MQAPLAPFFVGKAALIARGDCRLRLPLDWLGNAVGMGMSAAVRAARCVAHARLVRLLAA
eukprot:2748205-Pleurochrysis_carterae.AAC.1